MVLFCSKSGPKIISIAKALRSVALCAWEKRTCCVDLCCSFRSCYLPLGVKERVVFLRQARSTTYPESPVMTHFTICFTLYESGGLGLPGEVSNESKRMGIGDTDLKSQKLPEGSRRFPFLLLFVCETVCFVGFRSMINLLGSSDGTKALYFWTHPAGHSWTRKVKRMAMGTGRPPREVESDLNWDHIVVHILKSLWMAPGKTSFLYTDRW